MALILHFGGARFELADTEDGQRVHSRLAHAAGSDQSFKLRDGGVISVHVTSQASWVVERTP